MTTCEKQKIRRDTLTESFISLKHIKLKVTDACNLRCPKCDYWQQTPSYGLSTGNIFSLIDQGADLGLRQVNLSGGEPTLRKDLAEIVRHGSSKNIKFGIVSNGARLSKDENLALADAGIGSWTFSLDTANPAKYYELVGRSVPLQKVADNISALAENKEGKKLKINILTVVTSRNYLELDKIAAFSRSLGADSFKIMPYDYRQNGINRTGFCTDQITSMNLSNSQIAEFNAQAVPALLEFSAKNNFPVFPSYGLHIFGKSAQEQEMASEGNVALGYYDSNICFMPWMHVSVFPNGEAYICCKKAYTSLGNVKRESLKDILSGEKMAAARRSMMSGSQFEKCRSCTSNAYENRILGGQIEE